ncbi:hypothetical protein D3C86_1657370 [compost metagenome]
MGEDPVADRLEVRDLGLGGDHDPHDRFDGVAEGILQRGPLVEALALGLDLFYRDP